jgi:hypothetical protein
MGKDSSLNWRQIVNVLTEKVHRPLKGYVKNDELALIFVLDVPPARAGEFLQEIQKEKEKLQECIRNWFEMKCQIHSNCILEIVGVGAERPQGYPQSNFPSATGGFRQPIPRATRRPSNFR